MRVQTGPRERLIGVPRGRRVFEIRKRAIAFVTPTKHLISMILTRIRPVRYSYRRRLDLLKKTERHGNVVNTEDKKG